MRAHYFDSYGPKGTFGNLPEPIPEGDQVLVEIKAASVNPVDFKIRDGKLKFLRPDHFPLVLGGDGAGVVLSDGKRFKKGNAVFFRVPKGGQGSFAERIAISESVLAEKPEKLTFIEAAALPLVCLTSMQALFEHACLEPGQKVFIPAGSGGVGSHAIQIAKAKGIFVATTTSSKNVDWVTSLGADEVIDYTKGNFVDRLKDFDAVFDTLGGKEQAKAFTILKPGGYLVSIVGPATPKVGKSFGVGVLKQMILYLTSRSTRARAKQLGVHYSFVFMRPDGKQLEELGQLVNLGKVRPVLDKTFPFDQIDVALAYQASGRAKGKVVIKMG